MSTLLENRLPARWAAEWIDPELPHDKDARQPASVLRRRFTVGKAENAVLYITCHGLYEAVLNDVRVGDFVLAPGTGDYRKRLAVQAYDVSELLREGENEIAVRVVSTALRDANTKPGIFGKERTILEPTGMFGKVEIKLYD